jgi:hypothetical protein
VIGRNEYFYLINIFAVKIKLLGNPKNISLRYMVTTGFLRWENNSNNIYLILLFGEFF